MPHKLLLADDSVTIQRVIELTFADEDVQVVAVGDGKKAIASIEQDRPDIVLADVGMPERDGYEVAAFIKSNPQLAAIPVLLLTGAFEPIDETRARAVGCDGVLVKPFEPQMVINRVKDLLAGRRPAGLWAASPTAQGPTRHSPAPEKDVSSGATAVPPAASSGASLEDYFDRLDAAFANLEASPHPDTSAPPPQPGETFSGFPADILDGWDPDLVGDPARVEAAGPPASSRPIAPPDVAVPEPAAPPAVAQPLARMPTGAPSPAAIPTAMPADSSMPASPLSPTPAAVPASAAMLAYSSPPSSSREPAAQAPVPSMPSLAEAFSALLSAEQSRAISPSAVSAPALSDAVLEDIVRRVVARMSDRAVRDTVVDIAERLVREEIERIKGASRNL
jgi:CheY-like chemotaxis protein